MNIFYSKKFYTFISILLFFFIFLHVSCEKKSKDKENDVAFDTIYENKTDTVIYKKSKFDCKLQIAFTYPVSSKKTSQLSDLQLLFVEKFFPSRYANIAPQEAVNNFSADYVRDFQNIKFEEYFADHYVLEEDIRYSFELSLQNKVLYNRNNIISFIVKGAVYEGGAHGSNSIYGYVIDLNTGKFLSEDDFAGNHYKKNLATIIVQKIAASKGFDNITELENNGYNAIEDIVPNDNFTISEKGITYYFNEYEIAAYFVGITEVFIPFEEIKAYITNDNPVAFLAGN